MFGAEHRRVSLHRPVRQADDLIDDERYWERLRKSATRRSRHKRWCRSVKASMRAFVWRKP